MSSKYDESLLLGYLEEELTPQQRAQVEQWMTDDAHLGRLMRAMMADRHLVRDLVDPTPPDWVMDEVDRHLERAMLVDAAPLETQSVVIRQRHVLRRVTMAGAIAAMVAVVGGVVVSSLWDLTPNPELVSLIAPKEESPDRQVAIADQSLPAEPDVADKPHKQADGSADAAADNRPLSRARATQSIREPVEAQEEVAGPKPTAIAAAPEIGANLPGRGVEITRAAEANQSVDHSGSAVASMKQATDQDQSLPHRPEPQSMFAVPDLLAGVAPDHADLLKGPQPDVVGGAPVLAGLRQIQQSSARARELELHLVTEDVASTRNMVQQMLPADTPVEIVTAGRGQRPDTIRLMVPVTRLEQVLVFLRKDATLLSTQFQRRPVLAAGALPDDEAASPLFASPWPSLTPDYAAMLKEQIENSAPVADVADTSEFLPLIIKPEPARASSPQTPRPESTSGSDRP